MCDPQSEIHPARQTPGYGITVLIVNCFISAQWSPVHFVFSFLGHHRQLHFINAPRDCHRRALNTHMQLMDFGELFSGFFFKTPQGLFRSWVSLSGALFQMGFNKSKLSTDRSCKLLVQRWLMRPASTSVCYGNHIPPPFLRNCYDLLRYALPHRLVTREKLAQGRKEKLGGEVTHHGM